MGWVRRGKRKYYYRSRWVDGRVVKEYVGSGPEAEAEAKKAAQWREFLRRVAEVEAILDRLDEVCNLAADAIMVAAGYYRHDRGPWRKRRDSNNTGGTTVTTPAEPPLPALDPSNAEALQRSFTEVVRRARAGDKTAIVPLRDLLSTWPDAVVLLGGNVGFEAIRAAVQNYARGDNATRHAVIHYLRNLQTELAGPDKQPTGAERLLIDRVVSTWLHLHQLEVNYAEHEKPTFEVDVHFQKLITAAQGRYLAALRTLADVQRRPVPALQINVASEQVNVAGNATTDKP